MKRTHAWRNLSLAVVLGTCCTFVSGVTAAEKFVPPARPIPLLPEPPAPPPVAQTPTPAPKPFTPPPAPVNVQAANQIQPAQKPVVVTSQPVGLPAPTHLQPASYLAYDSESKELSPKLGETSAHFTFWITNVSKEVVAVNSVRTSCGCTVAQLPAQPWKLEPGTNGPIEVSVNLAGKSGTIVKSVTVDSTAGVKSLLVKVNIPVPTNTVAGASGAMGDVDRIKNMQAALADRQIIFKNKDCTKCHADPATDKAGLAVLGQPLYQGICANCHDSPNRASMVPNLHALNHPTSPEHWKKWITSGRVGSMMPAFAKNEGGILTDEQINSLVDYLSKTIPSNPALKPAPATAQPIQIQNAQPKQSASVK